MSAEKRLEGQKPEEYLEDLGLSLTDMLTEPDQTADVSGVPPNSNMPGEVKGAEAGVLTAEGITACVGIAVYDRTSDVGYVGHIITYSKEIEALKEDIQAFNSLMMKEDVDYSNSDIYFAGLDYDLEVNPSFLGDQSETTEVANQYGKRGVLETYGELCFDQVETFWGYEGESGGRLVLDANNAQVTYEPEWASNNSDADSSIHEDQLKDIYPV